MNSGSDYPADQDYRLCPPPEIHSSIQLLKEGIAFARNQVISCLFSAFIFGLLILSRLIAIPFIPRYDFLLLACIGMQTIMYLRKLETAQDLLVITMFHLLGTTLEIYKVSMGSWYYPEAAYSKIFGVPLYSGFMYASVGSYVCHAWRRFDVQLENWPGFSAAALVSMGIYLNFFTHHFIYDFRWVLTLILLLVFRKTKLIFNTGYMARKIPVVLAFLLIGFFIWVAENIVTYLDAWKYASQHEGWKMVNTGKISSWSLLVVLSIVIVANVKLSGRMSLKNA